MNYRPLDALVRPLDWDHPAGSRRRHPRPAAVHSLDNREANTVGLSKRSFHERFLENALRLTSPFL
jgi:hypothetical protein